jgi:hypothetical protein
VSRGYIVAAPDTTGLMTSQVFDTQRPVLLLHQSPAGDQLAGSPPAMRLFTRRERPHPGAQLTLFEAEDG